MTDKLVKHEDLVDLQQALTTRWPIVDVFGDDDENHTCCSCCAGYCILEDSTTPPGPELLVLIGDYISDRYVAVKADLVEPPPEGMTVLGKADDLPLPDSFTIPDAEPGDSTATFIPSRVLRVLDLGMDVRQGDSPTDKQHLYLDGEHVGWLMPARPGRLRTYTIPQAKALAEQVVHLQRRDQESGNTITWNVICDIGGPPVDALATLQAVAAEVRDV